MQIYDKDLRSIQEVRALVNSAKKAQNELAQMSQELVDKIVKAIADAGVRNAKRLAAMAHEDTGFGTVSDKILKNIFGSRGVYESIKDMKTVGEIARDDEKKYGIIAVPVGVIAGIIPSTNPTSTTLYKAEIAIKAGNAIIFSPHPSALRCIMETVKVIRTAVSEAGGNEDLVSCISIPTMEATSALMRHNDVNLILATGGSAMVRAAYESGTPAIGVGPGNGPAYIERSADIPMAVKRILDSKCFDNGTICASEQSVVTEEIIRDEVIAEFKKQGAYFLSPEEKQKVAAILMRGTTMNPAIVGKTPQYVGKLAGLDVPANIRVLIGFETEVGEKIPFSKEKLCPVLAFYTEKDWESACELSIRILKHEGAGHTMMIHSRNEEVIREFALKKPVSRLLVNTPGALGGIGCTTGLAPALTLGCGAVGGSATSENVSPMQLINQRYVAYGLREIEEIRKDAACESGSGKPSGGSVCADDVEAIVKQVLAKLQAF